MRELNQRIFLLPGRSLWVRSCSLLALALTAVAVVGREVYHVISGTAISSYSLSHYWLDYSHGFVRRGLLGEILALFGESRTVPEAAALATVLLIGGWLAIAILIGRLTRSVATPSDRLYLVALLSASPFTFSLVYEIGSSDSYGPISLALLVLLAAGPRGRPGALLPRIVAMSVNLAVATASEELLFGFVAVLTVLALSGFGFTRIQCCVISALALMPAVAIIGMSVLMRPSDIYLIDVIGRARAAGLDVDTHKENSVSALGQTARNGFENFLHTSPTTLVIFWVLCITGFASTVPAVVKMTGFHHTRIVGVLIGIFALNAVALSLEANDYRRWWAIAFLSTIAALTIIGHDDHGAPRKANPVLACALLIASLGLQLVPDWPAHWDPSADTDFSIDRLHTLNRDWH